MTLRAVLLGLLGTVGVCSVTYFNDWVMRQTPFIGSAMPFTVYGGLIVLLLTAQPLLRRIRGGRWALSGKEIAVVLVLVLAACSIPGSGFIRYFVKTAVLPYYHEKTTPAWQEHKLLERVPPGMLVRVPPGEASAEKDQVVNGFVQGMGSADSHVSPARIPWRNWLPAIAFWVPLALLLWLGMLGLAVVLNRQWSDHEQLPYPLAAFAHALLPEPDGSSASIFRNRLFWCGAVTMMVVHLNNYLLIWFPEKLIEIPLYLDFTSLRPLFPTLSRGDAWYVFRPSFFMSVVAFAFFLSTEVSISIALGPIVIALIIGFLAGYGIAAGGPAPNITDNISFGAFLAMLLVLLFTGRRFYSQVARATLGLPAPDRPPPETVWGGRMFLACMSLFVLFLMIFARLEWPFALAATGIMVMAFVVLSRIVAETGCFFVQYYAVPAAVLVGLIGPAALGAQTAMILFLCSCVLMADPREAFLSFMVNSCKVLDLRQVPVLRASRAVILAVVVAFAVAVPVTLYVVYDRGASMWEWYCTTNIPTVPFREALQMEQRLEAQGRLQEAVSLHGLDRLAAIAPDRKALLALAGGFGVVLLMTAGRLRFSKWPFHPVMFLIGNSWAGVSLWASFMAGGVVKGLVTHYGGVVVYNKLKPLMFGIIAGEMITGLVLLGVSWIYYFVTGEPPKPFLILPS